MTSDSFQKICVLGLGYVGLPTATFLAQYHPCVLGVDINKNTVDSVNDGEAPFIEPGFVSILENVVSKGILRASLTVEPSDVYIITVPTPVQSDHKLDPQFIHSAVRSIADHLIGGELIILESTSPPGQTRKIESLVADLRPDLEVSSDSPNSVHFAFCPERVRPGSVMTEMENNDRVVGGLSKRGTELAHRLYSSFVAGNIFQTDATTAEVTKLTENSFRDVNIAFANELSMITDQLGINVWEVISLANRHPRVDILQPGPGVGGHCIPVDPWFLASAVPKNSQLIKQARYTNSAKTEFIYQKAKGIVEIIEAKHPIITVFGIAFKPNIDDLRESPSLSIVQQLATEFPNAHIRVVEPHIYSLPTGLNELPNVRLVADIDAALCDADGALLLVAHSSFSKLSKATFADIPFVDAKGILESR